MEFSSNSPQSSIQIRGEGTDYVGSWTLTGKFDPQDSIASWKKSYLQKHRVDYSGLYSNTIGISGKWQISGILTGAFHIWPASWGHWQQRYLEQDLSGTPAMLQLN
ncbi:MAG: hypothetical protein R3C03_14625 [Pirellulaceae bacterium]